MARTVAVGIQDFSAVMERDYFYVDKTDFIREWWDSGDSVTLVARPRRFGKTLNLSMLERFFSLKYEGEIPVDSFYRDAGSGIFLRHPCI